MRRLLLATLIAAMSVVAPAFAQDSEIDLHRLDAMIDQSQAALHALSPAWAIDQNDDDADLSAVTARFVRMQAQACQAKLVGPEFCGAPPVSNDAAERITAFWHQVCTLAKRPDLCVME
ncbi:MAG TPA: hypothetical protein VGF56_09675 [Rhizomicrobium sp.]